MVSVPFVPDLMMGVAPLAVNCASVIGAPPLMVSEVSELEGPKVKVPDVFSPVPVALVPPVKSLSFTCASVPATVPSVNPLIVMRSLVPVTVMVKVAVFDTKPPGSRTV